MATGGGKQAEDKEDSDPRFRTLTEKGQALFDDKFLSLQEKCSTIWRNIEDTIENFDNENSDKKYLRKTEDSVNSMFKEYLKEHQTLSDFLKRERTHQSEQKLEQHETQYSTHSNLVFEFRDALHQKLLEQAEQLSEKSKALSQASKTSSEILKKRVKAETQKTRLKYLEERAALEKQKAATDIDIWLSKEKEAAAIANAELSAMEYYDRGSQGSILLDLEQEQTAQERTEAYVNNTGQETPIHADNVRPASSTSTQRDFRPPTSGHAGSYEQLPMVDLSNYLLKKDLLLHRFTAFDDSAQNYTVWKVGFVNILKELKVSPIEELDLLTKWLGPESKSMLYLYAQQTPFNQRGALL